MGKLSYDPSFPARWLLEIFNLSKNNWNKTVWELGTHIYSLYSFIYSVALNTESRRVQYISMRVRNECLAYKSCLFAVQDAHNVLSHGHFQNKIVKPNSQRHPSTLNYWTGSIQKLNVTQVGGLCSIFDLISELVGKRNPYCITSYIVSEMYVWMHFWCIMNVHWSQ